MILDFIKFLNNGFFEYNKLEILIGVLFEYLEKLIQVI